MNKLAIPLSLMGVILITIYSLNGIDKKNTNITKVLNKAANVIIKSSKKTIKNDKARENISQNVQNNENNVQNSENEQFPDADKMVEEPSTENLQSSADNNADDTNVLTSYETRLTSYYPNDGYGTGDTTASGLSPVNFETNENGWYTYNGKLVIATASTRLGYTDMRTYNLYDELTLNIDGTDYVAVVLDVCGACQRHNRIDLFVSGSWAVKDTVITVKE